MNLVWLQMSEGVSSSKLQEVAQERDEAFQQRAAASKERDQVTQERDQVSEKNETLVSEVSSLSTRVNTLEFELKVARQPKQEKAPVTAETKTEATVSLPAF